MKCGKCCLLRFFVGLVYHCNLGVIVVKSLVVWLVENVKNLVCKLYELVFKIIKRMNKLSVTFRL